jgi:hypothetical protein
VLIAVEKLKCGSQFHSKIAKKDENSNWMRIFYASSNSNACYINYYPYNPNMITGAKFASATIAADPERRYCEEIFG